MSKIRVDQLSPTNDSVVVDVASLLTTSTLSGPTGASLVGTSEGSNVQANLTGIKGGTLPITYRSTSVATILNQELSVKAFGAIGDGVTNDTSSIQACLDAAATSSKKVFFPEGVYKITSQLNITVGMSIRGASSQSTNGAKIVLGAPSMVGMWFHSYENIVQDLTILGFESNYQDDAVNGYGQISTCTGMRFQLDSGAKDIDSRVERCAFLALNTGIYGVGANLLMRGNSFTATIYGIDLYPAPTDTDNFRGFIIENSRWHKCGGNGYSVLYPILATSSCIRVGDKLRASKISDNYADLGIRRFFAGTLCRGSLITDLQVYQADGDIITLNNTSLSGAYESFLISNISVNNQVGTATNASGYVVNGTGLSGGVISNISGTFIRKGGISLTNSTDNTLCNISLKNINAAWDTDGAIYSGVEIDATSTGNKCYGLFVRNTLNPGQCRSVIHAATGGTIECANITGVNVAAQVSGGGTLTGNIDTQALKPTILMGSAAPSTGTWRRSDIVYNNAPASGGTFAWVCVTAGTPGTWRQVALLTT